MPGGPAGTFEERERKQKEEERKGGKSMLVND